MRDSAMLGTSAECVPMLCWNAEQHPRTSSASSATEEPTLRKLNFFSRCAQLYDRPCIVKRRKTHWADMASSSAEGGGTSSNIPKELGTIGMLELLEHDQRPTFVLDLENAQEDKCVQTAFQNRSLMRLPDVADLVLKKPPSGTHKGYQYADFKEWASRPPTAGTSGDRSTITYEGLLWICTTIRKRWRIITVSAGKSSPILAPADKTTTSKPPSGSPPAVVDTIKSKENIWDEPPEDWTDILPPSHHRHFFKDIDWSATALGPLKHWSAHLRQMVRFLMSDYRPAYMFW